MVYVFADWTLDTELFALCQGGRSVPLRPKAYRLLLHLLENRHRVVSKQALCDAVWPGRIISDATLESTIMAVRRALGDTRPSRRFIRTLHGHGYQFVADVVSPAPGGAAPGMTFSPRFQGGSWHGWQSHEAAAATAEADPNACNSNAREITVLYCDFRDLCGTEWPNPADLGVGLGRMLDVCSAPVLRFDGYRAQVHGDGFWAYYGYPRAQEDAARRAVLSGLGITDAVARIGSDFRHRYGMEPKVRIGIHTGRAVISSLAGADSLALGPVPVVATRLLGLAEAGAVVSSGETLRSAGDYVPCNEVGVVSDGNSFDPIRAYRIHQAFQNPTA